MFLHPPGMPALAATRIDFASIGTMHLSHMMSFCPVTYIVQLPVTGQAHFLERRREKSLLLSRRSIGKDREKESKDDTQL